MQKSYHDCDQVTRLKDYHTEPCLRMQLLTDKTLDDVSTHRRAEALGRCPLVAFSEGTAQRVLRVAREDRFQGVEQRPA